MMGQRLGGLMLIACSCWPVWRGLAALPDRDYLATALALALAWVLARTGIELITLADPNAGDRDADGRP